MCGQEFPATNEHFHRKKGSKDGFQSMCKACAKEAWKRYYANNAEDMRERSKEYHQEHPEKLKARRKRRREENPDAVKAERERFEKKHADEERERKRRYREENPEKARESVRRSRAKKGRKKEDPEKVKVRNKRFRKENPETVRNAEKRYREEHPEKQRAINRKRRAEENNAEGEYTDADLQALYDVQEGRCCWCGNHVGNKLVQRDSTRYENFTEEHIVSIKRGGTNWAWNIVLACWSCNCSRQERHIFEEWQPPNLLSWMRDYVLRALQKRVD
jgi:hypothetical protein